MSIETRLLLWIQDTIRQPWLDPVVIFITKLADNGWFWIATILIFLWIKKTRNIGWYACISLLLTVLLGNVILKHLVARVRPYDAIPALQTLVPHLHDYSFPSAHTAISFSVAMIYYYCLPKKWGLLFVGIAGLIALSRLYVGVHYPSDVLGGLMLGIGISFCIKTFVIGRRK